MQWTEIQMLRMALSDRGQPLFGTLTMRLSLSYTPAMLCVTRSPLVRRLALLVKPARVTLSLLADTITPRAPLLV
jgi:hypothetical protein